jgi:hypothetical protein
MAKERLSKLQKWVLSECLKKREIHYRDTFAFFGKKFTNTKAREWGEGHDLKARLGGNYENEYNIENVEKHNQYIINGQLIESNWRGYKITPRNELLITNSEKAILSRSLKGLLNKKLLNQSGKYGCYTLTEKGFLKANNFLAEKTFVSFKEYNEPIEKRNEERKKRLEILKSLPKRYRGRRRKKE